MDTSHLTKQHCVPCEGGVKPLKGEELKNYVSYVHDWELVGDGAQDDGKGKKLERKFKFKDFKESMNFVNKLAEIAEQEQHHPDIYIYYNKVNLDLTTHAIGGLSSNDFIMAAKIDKVTK